MSLKKLLKILIVFIFTANAYCGYNDWLGYGNTAARHSIAVDGPNVIDGNTLEWVADADPQDPNYYVCFENVTGPIVYNGRVYAYAKYFEPNEAFGGFDQTNSQLVAYDANSGQMLWTTVIDMAIYESWSSPVADTKNNNVLMPSGDKVYAIDASTGAIKWFAQLEKPVVNASACVAADLPYARGFITDFAYSSGGMLYCINLDANEPNNPYNPGEIIWSDILGATCGNSPAYQNGVVYVSSNSGSVYAYDANAGSAVRIWEATDPNFYGFSSGVTVTKEGFLYAVNFNWDLYGEDNSALCKIDCNDGSIVWIIFAERTSTMPVVAGEYIYISGGVIIGGLDLGSRYKVEAFKDLGSTVVKLWETPASMDIGGWSNQPVYANGKLYVGAVENYGYPYSELYVLDITANVNNSDFVVAHYTDQSCGSNPAVTYNSLYTIGDDGLYKFHQPALLADIDKNDMVDMCDLAELAADWLYDGKIGVKRADLNLDGKIDFTDFSLLADGWYGELN
jgi:outer membrane protein assembly factor BamB